MKVRAMVTAAELIQLQENLDRKLERTGLESQPEVAMRLLNLVSNPEAQLRDYAQAIRVDQAISGRVLRLANSSFFAQRSVVTKLDRACLVLGIDRLKSISLGFHLSHAATKGGDRELARRVWGESVFRACLAAEAAKVVAPSLVSEAFVVGLMIDAGIPLMPKLAGPEYFAVYAENRSPGGLFRRESESMAFTHVDVVAAMGRLWRLPELLMRPIEWHHTRPADGQRDEPVHRLHRVAYITGMLSLSGAVSGPTLDADSPAVATAQRVLGINNSEMGAVVARSVSEYSATIDFFSDITAGLPDLETLVERVHIGLIAALDRGLEAGLQHEEQGAVQRITVNGQSIEVTREKDGAVVAFLYDSRGEKLVTHRFEPGDVSARSLCDAFGLDLSDPTDLERMTAYVTGRAA